MYLCLSSSPSRLASSFLADDSVCSGVTVSRSVAVIHYVVTPQVLLPLTAGEVFVFFSGPCEAQPGTLHRVAYLTSPALTP